MSPIDPLSLDARRVLVVAPHPDDESLGCGGLLAALAGAGRSFHVVFVTDGAGSHRNSRDWPPTRLAAQREREAEEALERLGLGTAPRSFLRLPDAAMPQPGDAAYREALERLTWTISHLSPDLALLPWRRDPHRDHRDSWSLARAAIEAAGAAPDVLEYAIWLDELGTADDHPREGEAEAMAVDIQGTADRKRHAVAAHLSQTTDLVADDPDGFRLTSETIERLTGPVERYFRAAP